MANKDFVEFTAYALAIGLSYPLFIMLSESLFSKLSRKIISQEDLERVVKEEAEKLNISQAVKSEIIPESWADYEELETADCIRHESGINLRFLEGNANRIIVRHELYHSRHKSFDSTIFGSLRYWFYEEPSACLYALTGINF